MGAPGRAILATISRLYEGTGGPHRIVKKGTGNNQVLQASAVADNIIGVVLPDLKRASFVANDPVTIAVLGIVNVEAGAAVAVGARLTTDSTGRAVTAAALSATIPTGATAVTSTSAQPACTIAGSTNPERNLGIALTAAATAGDLIEVVLAVN